MKDLEINKRIAVIEKKTISSRTSKELYIETKTWPIVFNPVEDWAQGGKLIEKHEVTLDIVEVEGKKFWEAMKFNGCTVSTKVADTPLKAAMLAIIAANPS